MKIALIKISFSLKDKLARTKQEQSEREDTRKQTERLASQDKE